MPPSIAIADNISLYLIITSENKNILCSQNEFFITTWDFSGAQIINFFRNEAENVKTSLS